jgi:hypothetical protein
MSLLAFVTGAREILRRLSTVVPNMSVPRRSCRHEVMDAVHEALTVSELRR